MNMKNMKSLKKIEKVKFKSNQSIIFVIALMLITAGYYSYLSKQECENNVVETLSQKEDNENELNDMSQDNEEEEKIGEVKLVDSAIENNTEDETNNNENNNMSDNKNSSDNLGSNNESIETASANQCFTNYKLEREKMYSQMLDTYQKILESSSISEEQKSIASNEIVRINNTKNAIMVCEDLIKNKDIDDCMIFVNGDSVNIMVVTKELTDAKTAQIGEIVTRELKVNIENVHIVKK